MHRAHSISIAQKLCRDVVEPGVKPSEDTARKISTGRVINSSNKYYTRTPPTGVTAKTKIRTPHTSGFSIKQLKSGVTVLKTKIADSAVNTLVSGPLRCDNNCVTLIRKHNHQGKCKCSQNRKPYRASTKEIQTLHNVICPLSDKACTRHVETVTCGTQLLGITKRMLNHGGISEEKIKSPIKLPNFKEHSSKHEPDFDKYICLNKDSNTNQRMGCTKSKPSLRYISAKRWALTHYPRRGPDF